MFTEPIWSFSVTLTVTKNQIHYFYVGEYVDIDGIMVEALYIVKAFV